MLLRYSLQLKAEADAVERAVDEVLDEGMRTADIAGGASSVGTNEMTEAVIASLRVQLSSDAISAQKGA